MTDCGLSAPPGYKKVEQIDLPDALCVSPYTSIRNVFEQLKESQRGSVLVCRDGIVAGIFTERDASYLRALNSSIDQSIEKVMNPTLIQGHNYKLSSGGYRRLPVVDDDTDPSECSR